MLVRITFSARLISVAMPSALIRHGIGSFLLIRFCFARIRSAFRRRSPAVTRYQPVSSPSPFRSGSTTSGCRSPCAAMLAANSSSPTSAPVLRTLAGEGFSLLSGMSFVTLAMVAFVCMSISSALRQRRPIRRWRMRRSSTAALIERTRGAPLDRKAIRCAAMVCRCDQRRLQRTSRRNCSGTVSGFA